MGRLDPPLTGPLVLGLLGYTALSSVLGLTGRFILPGASIEALDFVYGMWRASLLADVLFVVGSVVAGGLAWHLATQRRYAMSALTGFGISWLTYTVSFMAVGGHEWFGYGGSVGVDTPLFVLTWGIIGLLFAAGAPGALHVWTTREESPGTEGARGVVLSPVDD